MNFESPVFNAYWQIVETLQPATTLPKLPNNIHYNNIQEQRVITASEPRVENMVEKRVVPSNNNISVQEAFTKNPIQQPSMKTMHQLLKEKLYNLLKQNKLKKHPDHHLPEKRLHQYHTQSHQHKPLTQYICVENIIKLLVSHLSDLDKTKCSIQYLRKGPMVDICEQGLVKEWGGLFPNVAGKNRLDKEKKLAWAPSFSLTTKIYRTIRKARMATSFVILVHTRIKFSESVSLLASTNLMLLKIQKFQPLD